MLSSHAYYAFEINLLFSNYAQKFFVHRQNISFPIVLKAWLKQSSRDDRCTWLKCVKAKTPFLQLQKMAELVVKWV